MPSESSGVARRRGQRRGLQNEDSLRRRLNREAAFRERLGVRIGVVVIRAEKSGRARLVSGGSTTSPTKADIVLRGSRPVGVSVKVSRAFEVDQRTVHSLASNLEVVTGYAMPDEVRAALQLLVGDFREDGWPGHLPIRGGGNNRPRLGAADLRLYKPEAVPILEEWLTCGLPEITNFVFGRGATVEGHAEYIWLYGDDDYDHIARVDDVVLCVERWLTNGNRVRVEADRSTLALPFGSLTAASASPNVVVRAEFGLLKALGVPFQ